MRIDIFTLFPGMFDGPFRESMIKRATDSGLLEVFLHNIRDFSTDKHRTVDDYPYGGGAGMVMKPGPVFAAVESVLGSASETATEGPGPPIVLLSPQGATLTQEKVRALSRESRLMLICGHYEGIDERIRQSLATDEISIGDYVLTGGELPAMVLVDAVARLLPGVLDENSVLEESFTAGLLEYPQYTRPAEFRCERVPDVLLSGHHQMVDNWRRHMALKRTFDRRPDLLKHAQLSREDRDYLRSIGWTE